MGKLIDKPSGSKLVLIDGNAILHRAYHALPSTLTTKSGEPINAVYGFVSMLFRIIEDLRPTHMAVAFDRKEPTFRHIEFKDYQAQRPETDKELSGQFDKVKKVVRAFGIPIFEKAGYEADDVIGTLARRATESKSRRAGEREGLSIPKKKTSPLIDEVIIVTGDRDILQLVTDNIKVYLPVKGLANADLMGRADVVRKLGVWPEQIVDYKALVGDPSDNYPGVSGIGPKTAENLLDKYGSYKNIYKNLEKVDKNTSRKLKEGKDLGDKSYKLAKIVKDVPIEFNLAQSGKWSIQKKEVDEVFSEFSFRSLARRLEGMRKNYVDQKQAKLF